MQVLDNLYLPLVAFNQQIQAPHQSLQQRRQIHLIQYRLVRIAQLRQRY